MSRRMRTRIQKPELFGCLGEPHRGSKRLIYCRTGAPFYRTCRPARRSGMAGGRTREKMRRAGGKRQKFRAQRAISRRSQRSLSLLFSTFRDSAEIPTALNCLIKVGPEIPRLLWALQRPNPDTSDKAHAHRGDAREHEMLLAFSRASFSKTKPWSARAHAMAA